MRPRILASARLQVGVLCSLFLGPGLADAGEWFHGDKKTAAPLTRRVVPTRAFSTAPRESLGTFTATPYIFVRGNAPAGGGYSPLGSFGESTMSLYGPLSAFRFTSAPVTTYTRGYDGRAVATPGTSFSTPNFPSLTPVISPTQASNYFGFRESGSPPWWANAINWLDQN